MNLRGIKTKLDKLQAANPDPGCPRCRPVEMIEFPVWDQARGVYLDKDTGEPIPEPCDCPGDHIKQILVTCPWDDNGNYIGPPDEDPAREVVGVKVVPAAHEVMP